MKNTISISKSFVRLIVIGILIGIALTIFFFSFFNNDSKEVDLSEPKTLEDCERLTYEAGLKHDTCKLEGLRVAYGIGYNPNLKNGESCFYPEDTGYCIRDETQVYNYLDLMGEACSKEFPKRDEVFAECLSKIES